MYEIYPKQLQKRKLRAKRSECFVLMPFAGQFDEVYSEIKIALKSIDFQCNRADDLYHNTPIMTTIIGEIISSHFVIADLSGRNPNVFYEVGIAHCFRDVPNVILISQDIDSVPFDLRHLPVILYSADNLRGLTTSLKKRILENKDYFEGELKLRERYYYKINDDQEFERVIEFFKADRNDSWELLLQAFGVRTGVVARTEVMARVHVFQSQLTRVLDEGDMALFHNLYIVFLDILLEHSHIDEVADYLQSALVGNSLPFRLDSTTEKKLIIELATRAFRHPRLKRSSLQSMLNYLTRDKVGGIDLNRSQIEHFLITTKDNEVKEAIVYALSDANALTREAMADLAGEMRLSTAVPNLIYSLDSEVNPYVARSLISALGKIGAREAGKPIIHWVRSHVRIIRDLENYFLVEFASDALRKIDLHHGTQFVSDLVSLQAEVGLSK